MPHSDRPAIQRFRETFPFGKSSGRLCYLCQGCELPPALEQAGWFEDDTFNEELAIQHEPSLKRVLEVARCDGFVIVRRKAHAVNASNDE